MTRVFASLVLTVLLALCAGSVTPAFATAAPEVIEPASGTGVPEGASGATVPFTNDGANRPVLETLTPDGQSIPIDPDAADAVKGVEPVVVTPAEDVAAHAGVAEDAHAKKQGLPQFDVS